MRPTSLGLSSILCFLLACGGGQKDPMISHSAGMSYWEIRELIFKNAEGKGIEWHGETLDQSAVDQLSRQEGGNCGQPDCGTATILSNTGPEEIEAVLQISHGLDDMFPYFARQVNIPAGQKMNVGCSQFCYGENSMKLSYKIVGARVKSK